MRIGRRIGSLVVGGYLLVSLSGCVALDEHRRVQAQNRSLKADKEALAQELFDARNANDTLRARVDALAGELETRGELLANLRSENDVLDEMRRMALTELERMAGRDTLGSITIAGTKLPEALDSALNRFAQQYPSLVDYDPARGTVKWKSDLLFPLGSDVVKESSMDALRGFSDLIKSEAAAEFEVLVVGHTDNRPIVRPETKRNHPTNWHLASHRAIAVSNILQRFGYTPGRIGVVGYGEFRPVADNTSEDGAGQNRRVEIYFIPRGSIVQSASAGVDRDRALATSTTP